MDESLRVSNPDTPHLNPLPLKGEEAAQKPKPQNLRSSPLRGRGCPAGQVRGGGRICWDVVVIGGGPAGMMAAGRAAELRKSSGRTGKILLLEKNPSLGKKLLISGGGRCNVTNNKPDMREMLVRYKDAGKFLFSTFAQCGVAKTISFFTGRGMAVKEEPGGRMFPVSDTSQSVLDVLVRYMHEGGVTVRTVVAVAGISQDATTKLFHIVCADGTEIVARSCVVATGGVSHPETGSTGDGFVWLRALGHKIIDNDRALVPIALKDSWISELSGVSLPDVKLTTFLDDKKQKVYKGKVLCTHVGISGPTVLNMSREVGELLRTGSVVIMLDLFPALDPGALKQKVQALLVAESNKKIKNVLGVLMPQALVPVMLTLSGIDGETFNHSVRSEDRTKFVALLKNIPLHVKGLLGADKAIISSGGAALEEIDFKTMQSRLVPGLYIIGDALDIDRPSGGYSLQICWTTGFVAGSHIT